MTIALRTLDRLCQLLFALACALTAFIALTVTYDVASRNLGLPVIIWAVNSVEYAMLAITFLAMPWLVRTRGHVCVEVVLTFLPITLRRWWEAALHYLAAGLCFFLAYRAGLAAADAMARELYDVRAFDMPMWLLYGVMPIGFFFSALQFLAFPIQGQSFYGAPPSEKAGL
ncbi:TRAP transporter small permease [Tropicimonas sp. IMCC34011]|uniref:TRAP transporter small permease n=1 Tax=Tropicimonas sp. IMCC34011 TaxID=2248759 RepID=UPI0013007D09|nr:TRAP transporter small permease [Tropicimonas sp. IMCC34011]